MPKHRVLSGKIDLTGHADAFRLGLRALELDAMVEDHPFAALELPQKIEMPPRAAEFAVGGELKAHVRLLFDDFLDFRVFNCRQLILGDLALCLPGTCLLEGGAAQQAADRIGAKRRMAVRHGR
jgi:hypothetical protein